MSRMFPPKTISDDEFWLGLALAHASFYRHKMPDELDRVFFNGKPIRHWIAVLEGGPITAEAAGWVKEFVLEVCKVNKEEIK